VKAEGCLEQDKPYITLSSSFNEWTISAFMPGSLPPKVGQTLVQMLTWMRLFNKKRAIHDCKKSTGTEEVYVVH
jgi:hypothetical protein